MASLPNWNFFNRNVQGGLLEGRYLNAAFTLVAAGPPRLAATAANGAEVDLGGDIAYPVGVLQQIGVNQQSQIMRLWEIGSERSYFIRGRTSGSISLGRIMFHGPSLLRVLYAYMKDPAGKFDQLYDNNAQANTNVSGNVNSKKEFVLDPGYENLWIDLASDVFSQPIGLLFYLRDSNEDTVGAFYAEYCMITNHSWSTDAGGTVLTEQAGLFYERLIPIDVKAVPLIKDSASMANIVSGDVIGSAADADSSAAAS